MRFEMSKFEQGKTRNMPKISAVEAEQEYRQFIPEEFNRDPIGYFERTVIDEIKLQEALQKVNKIYE